MALTGDHLAGDIGHIEDHNAIDDMLADVNTTLTSHATSISGLQSVVSRNYTDRTRSTTWTHNSSGSWLDVDFNSENVSHQDSGSAPLYANPWFQAPVDGCYAFAFTVHTATGTGTWYVQWTAAASVLFRTTSAPNEIVTCAGVIFIGAGVGIKAQLYQNTGGSQTLAANASASPFRATFTQVA